MISLTTPEPTVRPPSRNLQGVTASIFYDSQAFLY
jgi:hypothetical protein